MLLERARVDAELAIALTRQNKAEQSLQAATKGEVTAPEPAAVRAAR